MACKDSCACSGRRQGALAVSRSQAVQVKAERPPKDKLEPYIQIQSWCENSLTAEAEDIAMAKDMITSLEKLMVKLQEAIVKAERPPTAGAESGTCTSAPLGLAVSEHAEGEHTGKEHKQKWKAFL